MNRKYSIHALITVLVIGSLIGTDASAFKSYIKGFFNVSPVSITTDSKTTGKTSSGSEYSLASNSNFYKVKLDGNKDISGPYKVVKVSDGDTIKVRIGNKDETIRILGIDTPEKFATRTGSAECLGSEASEFAEKTLLGGMVWIEYDKSQGDADNYKRKLRHIVMEDGRLFSEIIVDSGFAFNYVYKKETKYTTILANREKTAKSADLGVWSKCDGKRKPVSK